jgi:adenylosuccinate lyase
MIDRYARPKMKRVWSEENKYDKWLAVEIAACTAWTEMDVIPKKDMIKLKNATYNIERLREIFELTKHDMTAFTRSITESLGEEGRWIHLGLTSSDVIDTAQSLQMVEAITILIEGVDTLRKVLKTRALEFKDTMMIGRTHGMHAEPITFGLKLALWWDEMNRNRDRLIAARDQINVGKISGAVGTHATIPLSVEERVCAILGLKVAPLSSQIIQRDRYANYVTTISITAASLEKFATEIRHLQRTEVREVEEPFSEGQTGSSAMPHKRNPELSERVCGLARLIRGYALTALENVSLWHERDISHSSAERIILPDSCMALDYMLDLCTKIISGINVNTQRMLYNMESTQGLIFSQRVMLALVNGGLSREQAYEIVQRSAMKSWKENLDFRDLIRIDPAIRDVIPSYALEEIFDYSYYVRHVDDMFKRVGI